MHGITHKYSMKPDREFAVNVKKNSANYRLQRGDRLTPKDGGGDCVGIMRLFKQGEDCPCTRTLQWAAQ